MSRSRFTKLLVRASLGLGLVWACSATTTPARAGFDQLWFLGAQNSGVLVRSDNGTLPYNSSIMSATSFQNGGPYGGNLACIDAEGASAANFTPVIIYHCGGETQWPSPWNQRWINSTGWCPNGTLNLYGYDVALPIGCSLWYSLAVGDNWGACIDVPGGNDANGQGLQVYQCNGTPAQVWRGGISQYGESPLWIRSNITGQGVNRCVTDWGRVVLYDCAYDF